MRVTGDLARRSFQIPDQGEFGKTALRLRFEKLTATTYLCSVKNGLISLWSLIIHDF